MSDLQDTLNQIRECLKVCDSQADAPHLLAAVEAVLDELNKQSAAADSLMARGESNRATQIRWCVGLVSVALADKLTGEGDEC